MADISEAEAILHLKRALGEIDPGEAVPPPLPPVQVPKPKPQPPPAKVPKTMPLGPSGPLLGPQVGPQVGPQLGPPLGPQLGPVGPQVGPTMPPTVGPGVGAAVGPQLGPQLPPGAGGPRPVQVQPPASQQQRGESGTSQQRSSSTSGSGLGPGPATMGTPFGPASMPGLQALKSAQAQLPGLAGLVASTAGSAGPRPPGPQMQPQALPVGIPTSRGLPTRSAAALPGLQAIGALTGAAATAAATSGGGSSAAAAAAAALAAAGPGKSQTQFEIPQAKVGLVIGKQSTTLNAIKAYSKAQAFIEQHAPDDDKARVLVVGSDSEVAKCKQTILALVDGTLSVATLFSLSGQPMPAGGPKEGGVEPSPSEMHRSLGKPTAQQLGAAAAASLAVTAPAAVAAVAAAATSVPGMPENQQMQQNLNDYYARWWSTYSMQQQQQQQQQHSHVDEAKKESERAYGDGQAFDKEALQRLAERAARGEPEPPAPAAALGFAAYSQPATSSFPQSNAEAAAAAEVSSRPASGLSPADLAQRASLEVQALLGSASASAPSASAVAVASAASPGHQSPPAPSGIVQGSIGKLPSLTLKGFLRPTEPPKPQKDDDSVQKMLERLQGNVQQTKQAVAMTEGTPVRPAGRGPSDGTLTFGLQEDTRTRADFEFEALMSRMQAAQAPDDVEHIRREFLIRFRAFTPQQAVEVVQKLDSGAAGALQSDDFLTELSRMLVPRLREFSSTQFTSLTSTFASWKNKRPGGRFAELSKALFSAASSEMSSRLMEFAPHEINMCLAAFVSVGFAEHRFFASVGRAALARHNSFAPVQLTAMLAILSEMRLVHTDLFNAAASFLSTRAAELRPVDIVRVLRSFAKCNVQNQGLCRAVSDEILGRIGHKGLAACGFSAEDLCEISWALCVLQHFDDRVIRSMFKALQRRDTVSAEALCQLYECHLVLDCEHKPAYSSYRIDVEELEALQDNYREFRKDERRCSERQRSDVASALKSLVDGSVHVNHRTSTGLLVDVAALRKRSSADGFVHVDLDTNVTAVRSLDQDEVTAAALITEGPVALRRRVLQKHGFRLITVRESEWRDLDDSKDKRRYLRSLLSALGDVLA